jgi:sarcosine oxidase, subunit alpha
VAFRLPRETSAAEQPIVEFWYDGRRIQGRAGEPVAASLLAAGHPVLSRSFRFHRPRGLMCSTGQCGWCECRVDGVPSVRTCRASVRPGMRVESEHGWPNAQRDVLGAIDRFAALIPNTFYHHRFLRPRAVRKRYLDVLRAFAGRGRLTAGVGRARPARLEQLDVDVLVIGGGPAGMLAADAAARTARVALVEAEPELGGAWRWRSEPLPDGTPLALLAESVAGNPRITTLVGTSVIGLYDDAAVAVGDGVHWRITAAGVIAATGSYERVPAIVDNDRPGVIAARTVEWLLAAYGIVAGRRALVVADTDAHARAEAGRVARQLEDAGAEVTVLTDGERVVRVGGRTRVAWASVSDGTLVRRVAADVLVFAARTPNVDIAIGAGAAVERDARGRLVPRLDELGRTTVARLAMVGACAGRPLHDAASVEAAAQTGRTAAADALASRGVPGSVESAKPDDVDPWRSGEPATVAWPVVYAGGDPDRSHEPRAFACFCEDVRVGEILAERRAGYADPEVLKRRTAALTGPCQGKYCLPAFVDAVEPAEPGATSLPTGRPPLRPVRLGELVAQDSEPSAPPA